MILARPALAPTILVRRGEVKDAAAIARVQVNSWRAQSKGAGAAPSPAQPSYIQRETMWRDILTAPFSDRLTYVATTMTGQVIGFVCAGLDCAAGVRRAEIHVLQVAPSYQRQGAGRQLLKSVASEFWKQGISALLTWVLAACPSRYFCEALGGEYLWQQETEIGGEYQVELAYGWKNLECLIRE